MSLHQLDFVIAVKPNTPQKELAALVVALLDAGFRCQARPGADNSTLVFVQLSAPVYTEIVQKDLLKCFELGVRVTDDAPADRIVLVNALLSTAEKDSGLDVTPGSRRWPFIQAVMPVTGTLVDANVATAAKSAALSKSLLGFNYRKVYGTGVALYFEFLRHYIIYLLLLALVGAFAFARGKSYSMRYTFLNLVGTVVFLLTWKRRERYLACLWGVQRSHKLEQHDAELAWLNADSERPTEQTPRVYVPRRDGATFAKEWAFVPVALVFMAVLLAFQLLCFVLEIFLTDIYNGPLKVLLKLVPAVAISAFVPIFTMVYNAVVNRYLAWENHNNSYSRSDSFIAKSFILSFLTGYMPLIFTSFVYLPFAHLLHDYLPQIELTIQSTANQSPYLLGYFAKVEAQKNFCMNQDRLNAQFFFSVVTGPLLQLVLKYVVPVVLPKIMSFVKYTLLKKPRTLLLEDAPEEKDFLARVRFSLELPEYSVHDDLRALALQFGYLAMFGPVWPLATLVCLAFNVLFFKLDTWRLANGKCYRPLVLSRRDLIHPWDQAFFILAWAGSVISPVVTSFYRNGVKPPKTLGQFALDKASVNVSSTVVLMLTLVFSEHLFFALYIVGSKASRLVVSKKEKLHSFLDKDLKVSKDYYTNLVQLKADVGEVSDWGSQTVEEVLETAQRATGSSTKPEGGELRSRKA